MRWLGIVEILLSGVCFGFLGVFGKKAYAQGLSSGEFLSFRFLLSAAMLGFYYALFDRKRFLLPAKSIFHCALLGILGYAVFSSCFFRALQGLSASLTVLLLYTYPIFVTLGAHFIFGETLSWKKWLALPVQFLGLALLVGFDTATLDPLSLVFGFGSAIFYAIYILASSRLLPKISPWTSVFYIQAFAALVLSALYLRDGSRVLAIFTHSYPVLLATAFVGSLLAMSLFLSALQKLKSYEASILSTAEPITGVLLAVCLLGEHLSATQVLGAALILGAMVVISLRS